MKDEKKELEVIEVKPPAQLIALAIEKGGVDLDKLEKLMILQERHEANEARKAYNKAMAEFKANPPEINKDRKVSFATSAGKTSYTHASLYNVTEKINAALSKYGLSASWTTKQNGQIIVTCKITHVMGHCEETSLVAPSDTSGSKNTIQAIGSTITYLERYTLLALTGLATYEQDDDAQSAVAVEYIDEKQLSQLVDLATDTEADMKKFSAFLKVESLEKLPKAKYQEAYATLMARKTKREKKGAK